MTAATKRRNQRPRDAATLVLIRPGKTEPEVLMGLRHRSHAFMPNQYVFPGGRVDPGDARIVPATPLRQDVATRLCRSCSPARARALAIAAVRETYEETGLMIGQPSPGGVSGGLRAPWTAFAAEGLGPALGGLDYVLRAVTPPQRTRRFNARFFVADATEARGDICGNGELEDIRWVSVSHALELRIPAITETVLRLVAQRAADPRLDGTADPERPVPLYRLRYGRYEFIEE